MIRRKLKLSLDLKEIIVVISVVGFLVTLVCILGIMLYSVLFVPYGTPEMFYNLELSVRIFAFFGVFCIILLTCVVIWDVIE